jgi:hypothetical protein
VISASPGTTAFSIPTNLDIPQNAALGTIYVRFRLSNQAGLNYTDSVFGGEVEDYQVNIVGDTPSQMPVATPGGPYTIAAGGPWYLPQRYDLANDPDASPIEELDVLVAAEPVEPTDRQRVLAEPVAGPCCFHRIIGHDLERQVKSAVQFILPLFDQVAGADNQASLQVASRLQFLDEQPGHDRLASPRVIGKQEPERLTPEHLAIHGGDLVGEWLDERRVNGKQRIEKVRQSNSVGFAQ